MEICLVCSSAALESEMEFRTLDSSEPNPPPVFPHSLDQSFYFRGNPDSLPLLEILSFPLPGLIPGQTTSSPYSSVPAKEVFITT